MVIVRLLSKYVLHSLRNTLQIYEEIPILQKDLKEKCYMGKEMLISSTRSWQAAYP